MISRIELITLHIADLLEFLGARPDSDGTLSLLSSDDEQIEVDLDDLCLTVKIEAAERQAQPQPGHRRQIISIMQR